MYQILIVDDEAPIRDLLAQTIRKRGNGYAVAGVAENGEEALQMLRDLRPDIVVTDIYMPKMNGLDFLSQAQAEGIIPKTVIISGYDEFDYARQAISLGVTDYLLKPFLPGELFDVLDRIGGDIERQRMLARNIDSLQSLVDKQLFIMAEKLYTQLVRGVLAEAPLPSEREAELFDFDADYFCAGQLMPNALSGFDNRGAWDGRRNEELMALLGEYFKSGIGLHSVSLDSSQTALLFTGRANGEAQFFQEVRSGLAKSHASLKKHFDLSLRCTLGNARRDWRELCDSYEEALVAWRSQAVQEKALVMYSELPVLPAEDAGDAAKQIREYKKGIMLAVGLGKREAALNDLEKLMKCYAALSSIKTDYIMISASELVYALANELEERHGSQPESLQQQIKKLRQQLEYMGLMELKDALNRFVSECCGWVQQQSDTHSGKRLIEQLAKLMEDELANPDLNLETAAERLNFSPHYIRQLFKQHTGEAFSDYVIRKRMERAGTLLRTTQILVQDIAEACGYANQRYFASSFKKYYGQTPTEYRQSAERKDC